MGGFLRDSLAACYLPFVFYLPIVWATAVAYRSAGIAALVMVLGPTLLAQYIFHLYQQRGQAYDDLTEASLSFAIGMIRALDASDSYTAGHSASVGVYARDLALELGYPASAASVVQLAALLHDVGKIGVPGEILRKPSKLNDEEWSEIRRHPAIGQQITGEVPAFRWIAEAIRHHHERPDGRGYPDGLAAEEIPRAALIIGAADAYSAMTSPRAYRDAITRSTRPSSCSAAPARSSTRTSSPRSCACSTSARTAIAPARATTSRSPISAPRSSRGSAAQARCTPRSRRRSACRGAGARPRHPRRAARAGAAERDHRCRRGRGRPREPLGGSRRASRSSCRALGDDHWLQPCRSGARG